MNESSVHTSTAYHPANDGHALRIPKAAEPWDSGYLVEPGDQFEVTLKFPGVYDYFCAPHEVAGMAGQIIVGQPGGPGTPPFDYFKSGNARLASRPQSRTSRVPVDRGDHESAPCASDSVKSAGNRLRAKEALSR